MNVLDYLNQIVLISISIIIVACANKTEPLEQTFRAIDNAIETEISNDNIPGAVVLISKDNKIVYHKAYGHAQKYAYGKKPLSKTIDMQKETLFDLASLTKVFASTYAIMLLIDKGLIHLDDPVHKHLPEFDANDKVDITIRNLLTHSSGLSEWKPVYYHATDKYQAMNYINELARKYPIAKERHYSDLGFMVLGYLVEKVSGKPLNIFLDENLYQDLNLKNTLFIPEKRQKEKIAATSHGNPFEKRMVADDNFGYKCDENASDFRSWRKQTLIGEVNDGNSFYAHKGVAGHAGLFSTAEDLKVLINVILNKGRFNNKEIIKEKTIAEFIRKDRFENGVGWAMSSKIICTESYKDVEAFGHTGFTGTFVLGVPKIGLAIILLTNRQNVGVNEKGSYYNLKNLRTTVVNIVLKSYVGTKQSQ